MFPWILSGRGILSDGKQKAARRTCTIWPLDYDTGPLDGSLEGFLEREGVSPCIHVHLHSTAAWHGVYWVIGGVMSRSRLVLRRRKKTEQTTYAICLIQLYDIERSTWGYALLQVREWRIDGTLHKTRRPEADSAPFTILSIYLKRI